MYPKTSEFSIEPDEACHLEDRIVRLLRDLRTPIPTGCQASIDATPTIVSTPVEAVSEEILEDGCPAFLHPTPVSIDEFLRTLVCPVELRKFLNTGHDRVQDPAHLIVLVDEHKSIRDIPIPEMDHTQTDPASFHLLMGLVHDLRHRTADPRTVLHPLETLPRVPESVSGAWIQKILLSEDPESKHVVEDVLPEMQGLLHEHELCLVVVAETTPPLPGPDTDVCSRMRWMEVFLQILQHPVHRATVRLQETVVVINTVQDQLHLLL